MTRINSAINVKYLTDEHLIAEHREIKRLSTQLLKSNKNGLLEKIPSKFCLGTGHVLFFLNKFKFTHDRYLKLHEECINRGFNVNNYSNNWLNIEKSFYETYKPTEEEKKLLLNRISERIIGSKKQYFHYRGEKINKEVAIELLMKS